MGFFRGSAVNPKKYYIPVSMPSVKTDTSIGMSETPKEAEVADLADYWRVEKSRRGKNGVRGTFTIGEEGDGE